MLLCYSSLLLYGHVRKSGIEKVFSNLEYPFSFHVCKKKEKKASEIIEKDLFTKRVVVGLSLKTIRTISFPLDSGMIYVDALRSRKTRIAELGDMRR